MKAKKKQTVKIWLDSQKGKKTLHKQRISAAKYIDSKRKKVSIDAMSVQITI
jgi:hypothetical protein